MPVLAIGGDHSYGAHLATEIGFAAADVRAAVIKDFGSLDHGGAAGAGSEHHPLVPKGRISRSARLHSRGPTRSSNDPGNVRFWHKADIA